MATNSADLQSAVANLQKRFPEIGKNILKLVVASSKDEQVAVYRLLCREQMGKDPGSCIPTEESPPPPISATSSPHSSVRETSPHSGYKTQGGAKSPEHQDTVKALQCPACSTQLSTPTQYPVNLICPACSITFRQSTPPRGRAPASHPRHDDNPRASWPACDHCGMQFLYLPERQRHVDLMHSAETEDIRNLQEALKRPLKSPSDKERIVAKWTRYLNDHVKTRMDTQETYNTKLQAVEQVEVLLRMLFPEAQVYLFGSTVSGASEKGSDVDLAVKLVSDHSKQLLIDDVQVIDSMWALFTRDKLDLPWYHGAPGQVSDTGLKKVTKTRVPIMGNTPPAGILPLRHGEEDDIRARTVTWTAKPDHTLKLDKIKKTIHNFDAHAKYDIISADENKVIITFELQKLALAVKMKDPKAALCGVPNVFRMQWDLSLKFFGVRNSALIKKYLIQPEHRLVAVAVKIWSRKSGINDPRAGLLSSYAIVIMYVYYLLCTSQVDWIDPNSINLSEVRARPSFKARKERPDAAIGNILYGFFQFYASFGWDHCVISLNTDPRSQPVTKKSMHWVTKNEVIVDRANSVRFHVCIEDPYEQAEAAFVGPGKLNLGRKVTLIRALRVRQAFIQAYETCFTNPDASPEDLFAIMVRF
eukprot:TRINITY_DN1204_c12_g1_i1.p1 TRINITY_DN1204_c12_g1~~TRINITY_DN1204_c12_g1_i1.p1  ORF type:complete len:645 (+),score=86.35 TRINITY_DN1204_c12_g1_i1:233-2167(+)